MSDSPPNPLGIYAIDLMASAFLIVLLLNIVTPIQELSTPQEVGLMTLEARLVDENLGRAENVQIGLRLRMNGKEYMSWERKRHGALRWNVSEVNGSVSVRMQGKWPKGSKLDIILLSLPRSCQADNIKVRLIKKNHGSKLLTMKKQHGYRIIDETL